MSTQIFNVFAFETPAPQKKHLTCAEVRDFCRHYNQHTPELDAFLERFGVDEWVCVGVDIEDVYSKSQRNGRMDCNPAELLGILITSQHNDSVEINLRQLLKDTSVQFAVDGNVRFKPNETVYVDAEAGNYEVVAKRRVFNRIDDCPLWVVHVQDYSTYELSAIVLLPSQLWDEDSLYSESAGYGYSIQDRQWYDWDKADAYRAARFGGYSPNFLPKTYTELNVPYECFLLDNTTDRLFRQPTKQAPTLQYHATKDNLRLVDDLPSFATINKKKPTGIYQKEGNYYISTKKGVLVTDTNFEQLEEVQDADRLKGDFLQHYQGKGWEVLITSRGIDIRSPKTQKRDKLSAFKIKAMDAGTNRLSIHAIDADHLVFLNDKWIVVDADLNITVHSIKRSLRKTLAPILGKDFLGAAYPSNSLDVKDRKPWMILNHLVLSCDDNYAPTVMNPFLYEKTGEFCFYGAVADPKRQGIWLLAGLERLIFMDEQLEQAFVFNTSPSGSLGGGKYPSPWLHLDRSGNLWVALSDAPIFKISQKDIDQQLKTATPHKRGN